MDSIIGYIDYNNNLNRLEKIISKIFFKTLVRQLELNKYEILINNCNLNNKKITKIKSVLNKENINAIVVSNNISKEKLDFTKDGIDLLTGKKMMKNSIIKILEYIYTVQNKEMAFDELYITINNDKNIDIIKDLAKKFKYINIVTDKIKKLKRLDRKLESDDELIYSISNNTKKSLKRASIIVNFDYDENFFYKFNVNRKAIIINLSDNKLNMKNSYQGIIIENFDIDYEDDKKLKINSKNFNKNILYESKIIDMKYQQFKEVFTTDNCKVNYLLGKNGIISMDELKKLIKLDKCIKMD